MYNLTLLVMENRELWKRRQRKKNLKTGIMLRHLYQSPMTAERWHRKEQQNSEGVGCVISLSITKICKSPSFAFKGKIFQWMLFWHVAMMAQFHPRRCFRSLENRCGWWRKKYKRKKYNFSFPQIPPQMPNAIYSK
jgi:hypothetical protein